MTLEDTLRATLEDYERISPDPDEVLDWLQAQLAGPRRLVRPRILAGVAAAAVVAAVAITVAETSSTDTPAPPLAAGGPTSSPSATTPTTAALPPFRFTSATHPGKLIPAARRDRAEAVVIPLLAHPTRTFSLRSLRGKVVVLTWAASWAAPSTTEYDQQASSPDFPPSGAVSVTIATKDNRKTATSAFQPRTAPGPVAFDQTAGSLQTLGSLPSALPLTVLIDRQQRVAAVYTGSVDTPVLVRAINTLTRN